MPDRGVEDGVEHRQEEHAVAEEGDIVLDVDESARTADLGVGEAEPGAEAEWIGEQHQQQRGRRQHEEQAEEMPVVEETMHLHALPLGEGGRDQTL